MGSLDGTLQAYHAETGEQLLSMNAPAPILSWLWVRDNTLYFGGGAPALLGKWVDSGENGMYAYTVKD